MTAQLAAGADAALKAMAASAAAIELGNARVPPGLPRDDLDGLESGPRVSASLCIIKAARDIISFGI
jgi:hypothetical protein